jgi:hypothetical protein
MFCYHLRQKARLCSVQKFFEKLFKLSIYTENCNCAHSLAVEWPAFDRMSVPQLSYYIHCGPFKTKKAEVLVTTIVGWKDFFVVKRLCFEV